MSVWDNIGRFNKGIQDWWKDVGLAFAAGPKFVWDVTTAPWNDREEFNGVANTLKQAGIDYAKNIGRPIGGVAAGAYAASRNILWEPLTAVALAGDTVSLGKQTKDEVIKGWKKAWEARQEVSLGQAYTELMPWSYGWQQYAKLTGTEEQLPLVLQEKFDIFDPAQRNEAFKKSLYGGVMSGTLDFWKNMVLDVTYIGSEVAKPLRTPDDPIKAIIGIDEAIAGKNNKYSKLGEDFAQNNSFWASKHPWVNSGNNVSITSHLLGEASTKEEALYTMKAVLGDPSAVAKLDELKRPDIAEPIRIANGELTRSELKILLRDEKMLGRSEEEGMLSLSYLRTPEEIAADTEFLRAYAKHDKYIAQLMGVAERPPITEGIASKFSARIDKEIASGRSAGLGGKPFKGPVIEAYQPTPFHRLYYKVSYPLTERPNGMANLNDGDSIKEATAAVNRLVSKKLTTPESGISLISNYAASATPEAKLVALEAIEEAGFVAIGKKYDLPTDLVRSMFAEHKRLKTGFLKEHREVGYVYDSVTDTNIKINLFESQTANFYPVTDFDMVESIVRQNQSALKTLYQVYGASINTLEAVSDLWKAGVLLRGGYPLRNGLDSQLRIMSVLGAATTLRHLGPGMKRLMENTGTQGNRLIDNISNYRKGVKQASYGTIKAEMQRAGAEMTIHKNKIDDISKQLKKNPDDPDLVAQLVAEQLKYDSKAAVYNTNNEALTTLEQARIKGRKKTLGQEDFILQSSYTTPDGVEYAIHGSFGGPLGPMWRNLASSERAFSRILDDYANIYGAKFSASGTRGKVTPDMDNYYQEWAAALNKSFFNAAVVKELLNPQSDINSVAKWLESSPAGIQVRQRLGLSREESLDYVATVQGFMNHYMPPGSGIAEELAKSGNITEKFLREAIKDPTGLPVVHGFLLQNNLNLGATGPIKKFINKAFKIIGSMPEDAWARNPVFDEVYRRSAQTRFRTSEFLNKKAFTGEEFNKIAADIEAGARADALKAVREILYNVERRSNLAHALRFLAPFISAQENAIKTWLKITADKPYIFQRAATLWYAPNNAGLITDENGDPVPSWKTFDGNETVWLQIPESMKKLPIIGPGLVSLDQVGISKRSVDVIFQGSPVNLGVGPYFAIPASYFLKIQPTAEAVFSWAFPFGPDASLTQTLPTWARRQVERAQGMDNTTYARTWGMIWLTEQQKARENGTPYKTDREVTEMTNALYNTRTWANLILPFAPQFQSPYRIYIEKYRQYSEKFGVDADRRFFEDYPEFFSFAVSLSRNATGSDATMTDVKNAKKYSDLIASVKDDNQALIGLITRGSKTSAFSPTAYWWQEQTSISPGTAEKFRGELDPKEAFKRNEAREGWVKFRKIQAYLDMELRRRGLSNVDQNGAEDLKVLKDATVNALASRVDPVTGQRTNEVSAWYEDYKDIDGTKTLRTIQGLRKIVSNPTFMQDNADNPTWKSVIMYLSARDRVSGMLAKRQSKSIDAKENADLKVLLSAVTLRLKAEDIGFSDLYDRYLDRDPVYDKYLGAGK